MIKIVNINHITKLINKGVLGSSTLTWLNNRGYDIFFDYSTGKFEVVEGADNES